MRSSITQLRNCALLRIGALTVASLTVLACSPPFAGTYADRSGMTEYEFGSDGKVYICVLGATASGTFEANSERILVIGPQGTVVFLRNEDRLIGPMGLELHRTSSTSAANRRC